MNTERQSKILLLLIMIQHTLRGQDYWLGAPGSGFNEVTALVAIPLVATCCLLLWRNVSNQDERCRIAVHILAVSVLKSGIVCDTSCFKCEAMALLFEQLSSSVNNTLGCRGHAVDFSLWIELGRILFSTYYCQARQLLFWAVFQDDVEIKPSHRTGHVSFEKQK